MLSACIFLFFICYLITIKHTRLFKVEDPDLGEIRFVKIIITGDYFGFTCSRFTRFRHS